MKKIFLVALVAILGTAGAVAQTALSFSGDRAVIKTAGKYYIPQSVWSDPAFQDGAGRQTLYIDIVNTIEPEIGFQNWTGDTNNSWIPENGSQRTDDEKKKQYIKVDVPGLWTNSYGMDYVKLYVRRIADPTLTVGATSKPLSQWSSLITVSAGENVTLSFAPFFNTTGTNWIEANGVEIDSHKSSYTLSGTGDVVYTMNSRDGKSINATFSKQFTLKYATVAVTGISLNKTSLNKTVGDGAETLIATISPANASNKNVIWSSSNASVATVSNGVVNFVGEGNAVITATTQDGNKTATCNVTVKSATVAITSVTLNKTSTTLTVGEEETLVVTINPANATDKTAFWSTSNPHVATVGADNRVIALSAGTANVTITTQDGNKTATCVVTVVPATVAVTGVNLNKTSTSLAVGEEETLVATVNPDNATNKNVSWSSSNAGVASVDATGKVKALTAGTATITVTTQDGNKTATCDVTVNTVVDYSWLTQPTIEFTVNGNNLGVKAVGVSSETFNKVTVNGTEISQTGGKWIVDISSAGIREIKMLNDAGVILTRTHQK